MFNMDLKMLNYRVGVIFWHQPDYKPMLVFAKSAVHYKNASCSEYCLAGCHNAKKEIRNISLTTDLCLWLCMMDAVV